MNPDSTLAATQTCPKDGVHLSRNFENFTSEMLNVPREC